MSKREKFIANLLGLVLVYLPVFMVGALIAYVFLFGIFGEYNGR